MVSCTVFDCIDFSGSTVLGMPESVGMKGQIDWQAKQISHLVCNLAGQRSSVRDLRNFLSMGRPQHHSTDHLKLVREGWRKEAADILHSKVGNICVQPDKHWHNFEGNLRETSERQGKARMGLSECCNASLSRN